MPWVNSNLQVQLGPPLQACHKQIEKMKKNVSVARVNDYRACPYFVLPTKPVVLLLYPSFLSHILDPPA